MDFSFVCCFVLLVLVQSCIIVLVVVPRYVIFKVCYFLHFHFVRSQALPNLLSVLEEKYEDTPEEVAGRQQMVGQGLWVYGRL